MQIKITEQTFYRSSNKYGGMEVSNTKQLRTRAEINPVPWDSLVGMKLASVTQWVSDRKTHKSHLPKAYPAGQ